jgi:membrane-bound ClpP family serine protease
MTISLIIGLILVGVVLILVEIFITPGFIVGTVGLILLAIGIYGGYSSLGSSTGHLILLGTCLFLGVALYLSFRDGAWSRFAVKDVIGGKANNVHELIINIGDKGMSISALRPAGTAIINDQKVEVHADGDFILANVPIEVIKKIDNKILIKKIN